jgi:VWFA-related protein
MSLLRPLAVLSLAALSFAAPLCAQEGSPAGPVYPKMPAQQGKPHVQQKPLVRRVSVVRLPVSVRDSHGELALDLGPEDFQVYDDGVLQHIEHFDVGGDPLAVVLVVENSSRVAPLLAGVRKTGIIFTETVMGANSKGAVISFDDTSQLVVPFTTNHDRIQKAISRLKPGDDGAHLYDALYRAVQMLEEQPSTHRRVIVVVSESYDSGSTLKLGSILRDAQLANISIYSLGLSTTAARMRTQPGQAAQAQIGPTGTFSRPGLNGVPQTPATVVQNSGNANLLAVVETLVKMGVNLISPEALEAASAATGGDHVSTFHDRSIERGMDRIGGELHAEYTLAYEVAADAPYGYHEITVKLSRPGYKIRTRPGYFLAPPNGSTTSNKQQ